MYIYNRNRREVRSAAACVNCCSTSYYRQSMSELELTTFVKKFLQLKKAGATAHLDVDTRAGEAWVRLSVQLQKPTRKPRRSPSYYRRQEKRKAAAVEATAESSEERSDDVPAEEVGSESEEREEGSSGEAATVFCPEKPSSAMNWINGLNEVEIGKYSETYISYLEAIIIDTIASIESFSYDDYGYGRYRYIKCRHCKRSIIEERFAFHRCYTSFQSDVIARVEPGASEVNSILCL